jgi:hypothetical protein
LIGKKPASAAAAATAAPTPAPQAAAAAATAAADASLLLPGASCLPLLPLPPFLLLFVNSLTAIDGHDRQYFNELRARVVSP